MKKDVRKFKVYEQSGHNYKPTLTITLKGLWLEELGFGAGTCVHDVHKLKSRDAIGEEYGMTGRNIARYMRVQQLEESLKEWLDEGTLPLVAAADLSYLSEKEQKVVSGACGKEYYGA